MIKILTNLPARTSFRIKTLTLSMSAKFKFAQDCKGKELLTSRGIKRNVIDNTIKQILRNATYVRMSREANKIMISEVFVSEKGDRLYGCQLKFEGRIDAGETRMFTFADDPVMLHSPSK